jgi:hypothetical protein
MSELRDGEAPTLPTGWPQTKRAVAGAAVLACAVLVLACGGSKGAGEPPGEHVELALPAAAPATPCDGLQPDALTAALEGFAVFERTQHAPDGFTVQPNQIPVATFDPRETRAAPDARGVTLVPTVGVRADERCERDVAQHDGAGICMVSGFEERAVVSCHTVEEIRTGRALALMAPRPSTTEVAPDGFTGIAGVVPDGVQRVVLVWAGGRAEADVADNGYTAQAPGLTAGEKVKITLVRDAMIDRARLATCEDPPPPLSLTREPLPDGVLSALPVLKTPASTPLPRKAADWLRRFRADRVWVDAARPVGGGDEIGYWAVVLAGTRRCSEAGTVEHHGKPWLACVLAIREDEVVFAFCNGPERGTLGSSSGTLDGRAIVTGICEPDAKRVLVEVRGRAEPIEVPVNGGAFGSLLPEGIDVHPPGDCRP